MGHNFSILTDRKSKNAPAAQKFYLYISMIWQNRCDVKITHLNPFGVHPTTLIEHEKFKDPYISLKKDSYDYMVCGTQNNRLELTVSMQKSVLKNMHRVLRY